MATTEITPSKVLAALVLGSYLNFVARKVQSTSVENVDVLVVGFGAAGASAAMTAHQTAKAKDGRNLNVLIVDRFEGGGATGRSGGIIYMGGGTDVQKKLGVEDTPENMYRYLHREISGTVTAKTLWRFCATSAPTAAWLRDSFNMTINVPDDSAVLCPFKTSNAPDKYSLFYSGSETAAPFSDIAKPCPRGHKVVGPGNLVGTGNVLYDQMSAKIKSLEREGVRMWAWHKVTDLIIENGRVVGAKLTSMVEAPFFIRWLYKFLAYFGSLTNPVPFTDPLIAKLANALERLFGVQKIVRASHGVVLAAGGFGRNQERVAQYLPAYRGCMPIGSAGDDGYGIFELGMQQAGAAAAYLDRGSAWKFIVPAASMAKGVLLDTTGQRLVNEDVYGARLAEAALKKQPTGQGWLVVDQKIADECVAEVWSPTSEMLAFQKYFTLCNLYWNRVKADSLDELARLCKMDPAVLRAEIERYNAGCEAKKDSTFGKKPLWLSKIANPPYYAVDFSYRNDNALLPYKAWMTPYFSLGGLVVDEDTGAVIAQASNKPIPGLFAAGRNAVGVPSKSYVSGLSLADCVYSGRRAGMYMVSGQVFGEEFDNAAPFAQPPSAGVVVNRL